MNRKSKVNGIMSNIMQNPKPNLYNPVRVEKTSLNRVQRKNDLMKITVQN